MSLINQPPHFFGAVFTLVMFALAVFGKGQALKKTSLMLMRIGFIIMVLSGVYILFTVPFSVWVLIKSLGGFFLFYLMDAIARGKGTTVYWGLLLVTAVAGLTIAYACIV